MSVAVGHACATSPARHADRADSVAVVTTDVSAPLPNEISIAFTSEAVAEGVLSPADSQPLLIQRDPGQVVPKLSVRIVRASEARDLLDEGVDVLVTDDPAALRYATARADLITVPLSWTRTYVLITPPRTPASGKGMADSIAIEALRTTLARDVVHIESRAAESPFWWDATEGCAPASRSASSTPSPSSSRIVYRRDDPAAGELAERLVAMAAMSGSDPAGTQRVLPPELRAAGARAIAVSLPPADFSAALLSGRELAYVSDLPARTPDPCTELRSLQATAPWLTSAAPIMGLVDTRSRAIVRRGRVAVVVGPSGDVHLTGPTPDAGTTPP